MAYHFNQHGWYTGEVPDGAPRSTLLRPANLSTTTTAGELRSNFTGYVWLELPYREPPPPAPDAPANRKITRAAWRRRLTRQEKRDLELAAAHKSADTLADQRKAAALRADLADLRDEEFVNLARQSVRDMVGDWVTQGWIASAERAAEILDGPIDDADLYTADKPRS